MNLVSWNINGNFADRSLIIAEMLKTSHIVSVQEHFALPLSVNQLDIFQSHLMYAVPAERKQALGRPSGGLVTYVRRDIESKILFSTQNILAVQVGGNLVVVNVYLPTDYRDDHSDSLFARSIAKLSECLLLAKRRKLPTVILGDFNCPLSANVNELDSIESSLRENMIYGLLDDSFIVSGKTQKFTFIHSSGSAFDLDHVICSKQLSPS